MNSIKSLLSTFLLIAGLNAFSQSKADSISLILPKVLIVNSKKEVLLVFDSSRRAFEVPSIGVLQGPIDFDTYIQRTTKEIGINYTSYKLGGLFTYVFPEKFRTFIRPYFIVNFKSYSNGQDLLDTSCKWFPIKNALTAIPYPASSYIIDKVLNNPKAVWAATFEEFGYTNPVDTSKIKFKVVQDFYKLSSE